MSDPNNWHAPGDPPPRVQPPAAPPVAPANAGLQQPVAPPIAPPPLAPPPGYGSTWAPPPPGYGSTWAPPPKPGLIPLRPLTLGTVLGASFQVLRRNPRPTFGLSLVINAITLTVFGTIVLAFVALAVGRVGAAAPEDQDSIVAGAALAGGLTLLVPLAGSIAVSGMLQGIFSLEVARGTLGEKLRARGLYRLARGRIGALAGWALLVAGVWIVVIGIASAVIGLLIALGGTAGIVIGVLLGVGAALVFLVAALWLGTKTALVPSVLMLERVTLRAAVARSWRLTNGSFWKTLGTLALTQVIVSAASQVITTPVSLIASIVTGIIAPTGDETSSLIAFTISQLVVAVVSLIVSSATTVMVTATSALVYIDLRMRKEGLDLELQRFVEARQTGDTSITDPYLQVPVVPAATV